MGYNWGMSTDPSQVHLTPEQQQSLADLADKAGKPWTLVFSEALGQYRVRYVESGEKRPKAVFGGAKGLFTMAADFDAPLNDFQEYEE